MPQNDIICPNCGEHIQPGPYCPVCDYRFDQAEKPMQPSQEGHKDAAVSGRVVAVSGNIDNSSRSSVDSHDVHQTTYNNVTLTAEAEREKRHAAYRAFCEPLLADGFISKSDRARIAAKAQQLSISPSEALEIEETILKSTSHPKTLTLLQSEMLDEDICKLLAGQRSPAELYRSFKGYVDEGYEDEKVLFYYYLASALANPSQLTNSYQQQRGRYFCYWQCYWACLAYVRLWKPAEARQLCTLLAGCDEESAYNTDNLRLAQLFISTAEALRTGSDPDKAALADKLGKIQNYNPLLMPLHSALEYISQYSVNGKIPATDDKAVTLMLSLLPDRVETAKPKPTPVPKPTQMASAAAQQTFSTSAVATAPTPATVEKKSGKGFIVAGAAVALVVLFFLFRSGDDKKEEITVEQPKIEEQAVQKDTQEPAVKVNKQEKAPKDTRPATTDAKKSSPAKTEPRPTAEPTRQIESTESKSTESAGQEAVSEPKAEPTTPKALIRKADKLVNSPSTRAQAIEYYEQAAEAGNAEAMVKLGKAYDMAGATQNKAKAKLWLEKAKDSGDEIQSATARSYLSKHSL